MRQARESPWVPVSRDLVYSDFKNWARASFIFFDDLLVFLCAEKIRANFVIYATDSDGKVTDNDIEKKANELQKVIQSIEKKEERWFELSGKME